MVWRASRPCLGHIVLTLSSTSCTASIVSAAAVPLQLLRPLRPKGPSPTRLVDITAAPNRSSSSARDSSSALCALGRRPRSDGMSSEGDASMWRVYASLDGSSRNSNRRLTCWPSGSACGAESETAVDTAAAAATLRWARGAHLVHVRFEQCNMQALIPHVAEVTAKSRRARVAAQV